MAEGAGDAERGRRQQQQDAEPQQHLRLGIEHQHQQHRAGGVAEEDVAGPQEDEMQHAEHRQRQRAPQVGREEAAAGLLRTRQHHREAHPEQQREHGPELAAHEHVHEPAGPVVDPAGAGRHAHVELADRPVEELHVHQRDAEQGEATHHVQRLDAIADRDRLESRVHPPTPRCDVRISACRFPPFNQPEVIPPSGIANENGPHAMGRFEHQPPLSQGGETGLLARHCRAGQANARLASSRAGRRRREWGSGSA